MAADFKATNDLKLSNLFESRKDYRDNAFYSDGVWEPGVEDFYMHRDMSFYGRIDANKDFVIPYKARMSTFGSSQSPDTLSSRPMALDFVVDAYNAFMRDFERLLNTNACGLSVEDINLSVAKAWTPVRGTVDMLYDAVNKSFLKSILRTSNKGGDVEKSLHAIKSFEQYVKEWLKFYKKAGHVAPVTVTGVLSSKRCFLTHTALCITLSESKLSDDTEKSIFMNKKVFEFYKQAAQQHGFMVNRNAPWQIVANIESERMRAYMEDRFTSPEQVWQTHFRRVHYMEIEDFKKRILRSWNTFVAAFPTIVETEHGCGSKTTVCKITKRKSLTRAAMESRPTSNHFWINVLCNLKNSETDKPLTKGQLDSIIKNAIKVENNLDMVSALDYINDQYKGHPLNNRMAPIKFFPDRDESPLDQISRYQSNVLVETDTYYEDIATSMNNTDSSY